MRRGRSPAMARMAVLVVLVATSGCASSSPTPLATNSAASPAGVGRSASPSPATATAQPTVEPTPTPPTATDATFALMPADPPAGEFPAISCEGDIGSRDQVAIVELRSKATPGPVVMRDYRDPAHPTTVCEFGSDRSWNFSLLDARHLLTYRIGCDQPACAYAVVDVPAVRYHWFQLPDTDDDYEELVAVSPQLDAVAWQSKTYSDPTDLKRRTIYVTRDDGDKVVGHLPGTPGGFCGGPLLFGDYAASGDYFYLLDYESGSPIFELYHGRQRAFSLRAKSGSAGPGVPIWSPTDDTLYYVRGGDVWRWTAVTGPQRFMPGISWSSVTISPDGRYIAYAVAAEDGSHNAYLVDLTIGLEPHQIGRRRDAPRFLTDTQLWLQPEPASQGCVGREPPAPVIYDLNEKAESPSIIRSVRSTWPAT